MSTRFKVREDITSVSVGEKEFEPVEIELEGEPVNVITVDDAADVAALAMHERDGALTRLPDDPPAAKGKAAKGKDSKSKDDKSKDPEKK